MSDIVYDIEFSYTSAEQSHLMMAATSITVDHEITTTDDLRKVTAEIGRQNGYTSCKIVSIVQRVNEQPTHELPPIDPKEWQL